MDDATDALPRTDVDLEGDLEALREWVNSAPHALNHSIWLDLVEFENRLQQIINLLPREVRRARRICKEEQRLLKDAKDETRRLLEEARAEADQIVTDARTRSERQLSEAAAEAERLVESSAIRQRALEQAEATLAAARDTAGQIKEQSYQYSRQVIDNVVTSLRRLTHQVETDRAQLDSMDPSEE